MHPISALVLAGFPTTKIFAFCFAFSPKALPCSVKIPPLIFNKSARSSIFLPFIVIPLGILPTNKAQSISPEASLISEKLLISPNALNPQSSNSILEPSNFETT